MSEGGKSHLVMDEGSDLVFGKKKKQRSKEIDPSGPASQLPGVPPNKPATAWQGLSKFEKDQQMLRLELEEARRGVQRRSKQEVVEMTSSPEAGLTSLTAGQRPDRRARCTVS